jgi:hypothetical protein
MLKWDSYSGMFAVTSDVRQVSALSLPLFNVFTNTVIVYAVLR